MKTRTRWILITAVLGAVALAAVWQASGDNGLPVETAVVARDTLRVTVSAEGQTRLVDTYTVAAPITGLLSRIDLDAGDPILAGRQIATVDPALESPRDRDVARSRVAAAEAERAGAEAGRAAAVAQRQAALTTVAEAEARAAQALREASRAETLARDSILSRQEAEQAALAARLAEDQLAAARAALRAADAQIAATAAQAAAGRAAVAGAARQAQGGGLVSVLAPATGRVLRLFEPSSRIVMAGTPLLEIGDADAIEIVVEVLSEDAVRIASGDEVLIDAWGGDGTLRGEVRLVEPSAFTEVSALGVEEQKVRVIVDLANPPLALGAGYRVEARIVTDADPDALLVPTSALFQANGVWTVFVVEDGVARTRAVRLGSRITRAAAVLGGLASGDRVVLFPPDDLTDGARVAAE